MSPPGAKATPGSRGAALPAAGGIESRAVAHEDRLARPRRRGRARSCPRAAASSPPWPSADATSSSWTAPPSTIPRRTCAAASPSSSRSRASWWTNGSVPAGTRMKQHGFGRNKPWAVREQRADAVRLGLVQDEETRAQYPVRVRRRIRRASPAARPAGRADRPQPGHAARCPSRRDGTRTSGARPRARREVTGDVRRPATRGAVHGRARVRLRPARPPRTAGPASRCPGLGRRCASPSRPRLRHLQFWSQPGRDFVCLEPFFGPNNTVNTDRRMDVPPGQARDFWMRIEVEA